MPNTKRLADLLARHDALCYAFLHEGDAGRRAAIDAELLMVENLIDAIVEAA